ncbi:MAG: hypothetical protein A3C93_05535 [Candidatus Lloydbacteria bacterium RIFCSPHIGHO2_02_FULL_54_17]|uniref:Uncharacterized protein n=1 Tax=Candidatus Lloydbacteria bacterium RIFCSPHIGHO2_02_FULL_54_17 TaxID=1798664 RepID=A0A1G2DCZ3_9BACT|nr:MAG: hypothetical protein A3C93_05535 [Candidatus Lloydbacteria bacterium RIFCSPHIGHO2_02_FULL_54_17]OGZ13051.1 MAG: hypothetical protein A2948_03515 [Candidatus Lloydbacteria bacterium RIFCSPLOWO2_01_FULL_54_18]OGZ16499.1 MAG: hypothetical protein A3H76_04375 [Candidatus Lloydbacteria bacterium RIFCSPLOWO2_02_FULL_54_12]
MATVQRKQYSQVLRAYNSGKTAKEVSDGLGVDIDAVYYFMRKHKIPRRSLAVRNKLVFAKKRPSFLLKRVLGKNDVRLKLLGVAIYWAEGYKSDKAKCVDLANSDPDMIRIFMKFLRNVCGVDENRLRVLLYCHDRQKIPELIAYWSHLTKISPRLFTKPYVPKRISSPNHRKMSRGLIHVRYYDKKLLQLILSWIEEYKKIA